MYSTYCDTLKKFLLIRNWVSNLFPTQSGFSIMEIAAVMLIAGIVIAPGASMYRQYRVEKDWDEITDDLDEIANAIGGYRAVYGHYPCPSPTNAPPGNTYYGFQYSSTCVASAPAPGSCVNGICAYKNSVSGEIVLVGSLPYKALNLDEKSGYDSYKNRYTYAVTLDLTDNISFDLAGGGISILDAENPSVSLIEPAGKAHFVILSHGLNGAGAVSRGGVIGVSCSNAPSKEQENCDNDADFMAGRHEVNDFDDRVIYFTSVYPTEWQISASTGYEDSIHLKNTNSVAVGADFTDDLGSSAQTTIKETTSGTGSIYATSSFVSEHICTANGVASGDCFEPEQIAGTLKDGSLRKESETNGEGMSCYIPSLSKDYYMTGIANSDILCSNEIFVICPSGKFITGITASGKVECSESPGYWCDDYDVTPTCDSSTTFEIEGTYNGGYRPVYSGECQTITDYDYSYFESKVLAMSDISESQTLIDTINAETRTVGDCGTDPEDSDTQVRDAWLCTNGSWSLYRSHERGYYWNGFPSSYTSSDWIAQNDYTGTDMYNTNGNYPSGNTIDNHDCWCREDYRAVTGICDDGYAGNTLAIQKHPCPQTAHRWETIYETEMFCGCVDGTDDQTMSCNDYYEDVYKDRTGSTISTTGLRGTVYLTYDMTCDTDGNRVTSESPTSVDTSECACATRNDVINRTNCDTGYTNSWNWTDSDNVVHTEKGVYSLYTVDWVCPGTSTYQDDYGNWLPDPGAYGVQVDYGPETCVCDTTKTEEETIDCSVTNQRGDGMVYVKEWDCTLTNPDTGLATGWWEDEADWELDETKSDCHDCSWQSPGGTNTLETYRYGGQTHEIGASCSCNDDSTTSYCNQPDGGKYKVWSSCPCVENSN